MENPLKPYISRELSHEIECLRSEYGFQAILDAVTENLQQSVSDYQGLTEPGEFMTDLITDIDRLTERLRSATNAYKLQREDRAGRRKEALVEMGRKIA